MQRPYGIRVMSSKGGVGKSVVATNLAAALQSLDYKVLILDTDVVNPCVGLYFGKSSVKRGLMDVMHNKSSVKGVMVKHAATGVQLLPGVISLAPGREADARVLRQAKSLRAKLAKLSVDFVVVDSQPGEAHPVELPLFDEALLVTTPNEASCISAFKMLTECRKAGLKSSLVINKWRDKGHELSVRQIEEICETKSIGRLSYDENVNIGVMKHEPVFVRDRNSPFSREMLELANIFATRVGVKSKKRSGTGLFDFI
ncbi:MAG: P-loop NTPase [Candidatus Micrarchaeota archaeon]|nr:P-loop NTPase [Candidatus Micrarchaeota archaeon]